MEAMLDVSPKLPPLTPSVAKAIFGSELTKSHKEVQHTTQHCGRVSHLQNRKRRFGDK